MSKYDRIVDNPEEFRKNITIKLNNIIKNTTISENLEKGIYNYTLTECENKNLIKKWNNSYFVLLYQKLKIIFSNLSNKTLFNKLINKEFKAHELAFMTHQELRPELWDELII